MGELVKTQDTCILYGIPKVYYGRMVDGHIQGTPFPMCLQSVLNYMGQSIGYAQIMATSGAAFRLRWNKERWDLGAVDIRNIYEKLNQPFELAFASAGRRYTILEKANADMDAFLNLIKSELDCGRPLIALGVVGPPEACIVTGYQKGGEALLGWSFFQQGGPFSGSFSIDESGYFCKEGWWENTEALMAIGEEVGQTASEKSVLQNALTLMTQDEVQCGTDTYYGGQAVYEMWAQAILNDDVFMQHMDISDNLYCQGDAETMLGEGRDFAAVYLYSLAEAYPKIAHICRSSAELLCNAAKCVPLMWEARGGFGLSEIIYEKFRERPTRERIAALIRQAALYEKEACRVMEELIRML